MYREKKELVSAPTLLVDHMRDGNCLKMPYLPGQTDTYLQDKTGTTGKPNLKCPLHPAASSEVCCEQFIKRRAKIQRHQKDEVSTFENVGREREVGLRLGQWFSTVHAQPEKFSDRSKVVI